MFRFAECRIPDTLLQTLTAKGDIFGGKDIGNSIGIKHQEISWFNHYRTLLDFDGVATDRLGIRDIQVHFDRPLASGPDCQGERPHTLERRSLCIAPAEAFQRLVPILRGLDHRGDGRV